MTGLRFFALGGALVLAGCVSGGGGGGGGGAGPGSIFTTTAGGLAATGTVAGGGIEVEAASGATSAEIDLQSPGEVQMSFSGGDLDGRSIGFAVAAQPDGVVQGDATSGLQAGEHDGNLTAIYDPDNASFAGVVSIVDNDFDNLQDGGTAKVYALFGPTPQATHTAYVGNDQLTYNGRFVGAGADGVGAGGMMGDIEILANFGTGGVTGTIDDIRFRDSNELFGGGDVGFAATMSSDRASYEGTDITMDGVGVTGTVMGGFYGAEAAETAGAVFADDEAGTAMIGGFHGTR